jgi:hypothetical protein
MLVISSHPDMPATRSFFFPFETTSQYYVECYFYFQSKKMSEVKRIDVPIEKRYPSEFFTYLILERMRHAADRKPQCVSIAKKYAIESVPIAPVPTSQSKGHRRYEILTTHPQHSRTPRNAQSILPQNQIPIHFGNLHHQHPLTAVPIPST